MPGGSVDEYRAPLFVAWQLTNRCQARCIACCEESGPDRAWRDPEVITAARSAVEDESKHAQANRWRMLLWSVSEPMEAR